MGDERGDVRSRALATKARDYRGIRYGNITPTDIDGLLEYQNKGFVLIETKYGDSELPMGQRLALERLCDSLQKKSLLIISSHQTPENQPIDMAAAMVTEYRYQKQWRTPKENINTKTLIDRFINSL